MSNKIKVGSMVVGEAEFWKSLEVGDNHTLEIEGVSNMIEPNKINDYIRSNNDVVSYINMIETYIKELKEI